MDMKQYLDIFIDEAKEHLQSLNQCMLEMEKKPDDTDIINEIFRSAHTLKGMSATMGFNKMSKLTHGMEDVLQSLRNNEIKANSKMLDALFKCLDVLENYMDNIASNGAEGDAEYEGIVNELKQAAYNKTDSQEAEANQKDDKKPETTQVAQEVQDKEKKSFNVNKYDKKVMAEAKKQGLNAYGIEVSLNTECVMKSARAFVIFNTLEKYGEIIKSQPSVEDIEDEKFDYSFSVVVISKKSEEFLKKEIEGISEVVKVEIEAIDVEAGIEESGKKEEEHAEEKNEDSQKHVESSQAKKKTEEKNESANNKQKTGKTVRVDIDRLDVLMNLVGELIITKTRLKGIKNDINLQDYNDTIEYLERITTSLNDAVMKVRMVPVEMVFSRFPRVIRDISRELSKEIVLTMSGEETELDRTVIDEIGDPLIHLLRNAADHGVEKPEERVKEGKPKEGHIYLRAYQDGNNVIIEVEDDGRGIDVEKVKKKAVEKGVIDEETAKNMSKDDVISLLFQPSFSTADKISDISGRGVGLDVVKTKIEALGGYVEVVSELKKGTKFIVRLPLTLAIIQALLVQIENEKYAIPLSSVNQILDISTDDIKMVQKQEVILYKNNVIPILRLKKILGVPGESEQRKQATVVLVQKGEKKSGLLVDSIIGQQEIVQKSLGKLLSGIKVVTGATIMGDGNVALILDVNSII